MKSQTRIIALINTLWFFAIIAFDILYRKETISQIITQRDMLLILAVFLLLVIGFLIKSKFAWTLNFVWGALIISGMIVATISGLLTKSDASGPMGINEIIVLTGVAILIALTTYSLIRTFKQDILNEMKVGRNQKRITLVITIILVGIWIFQ
jgi:hypothetical protein